MKRTYSVHSVLLPNEDQCDFILDGCTFHVASFVIQWFFFVYVTTDFSPCETSQFQCKNQECIDSRQHCDEKVDCNDGSDEEECGK